MRFPFLVVVLATPYARKGASLWQGPQTKFCDCYRKKVAFPSEISDARATTPPRAKIEFRELALLALAQPAEPAQ
jgi:hypothetical protein